MHKPTHNRNHKSQDHGKDQTNAQTEIAIENKETRKSPYITKKTFRKVPEIEKIQKMRC